MLSLATPASTPSKQFAQVFLDTLSSALSGCTRSELLTYTSLAAHADPQGHCWPGRERLSALTGLDIHHISRATRGLVEKGIIRKDAVGRRVHYTLLDRVSASASRPVPIRSPRTEQKIQNQKSAPATEPSRIEPPDSPTALCSQEILQTLKTPPPDGIPDSWIELARQLRPDLAVELIEQSAEVFLNHFRAKGTLLKQWVYAWKNWIKKERAPRTPKPPSRDSRYSHTATPLTPEQKAVRDARIAAMDEVLKQQHEDRLAGYRRASQQDKQEPTTPIQRPIDRAVEETERERQQRIELERQRVLKILAERGIRANL